jgi:hypothetical protein
MFSWLKPKPIPAPTDLELKLVETLEAATECLEGHNICDEIVDESRQALLSAKAELGIVGSATEHGAS